MEAEVLQSPGAAGGPCNRRCAHEVCAQVRKMAVEKCVYCGRGIGYGARFYHDGDGLAHAACLEEKSDYERRMR